VYEHGAHFHFQLKLLMVKRNRGEPPRQLSQAQIEMAAQARLYPSQPFTWRVPPYAGSVVVEEEGEDDAMAEAVQIEPADCLPTTSKAAKK
jgi:hypothetical protein